MLAETEAALPSLSGVLGEVTGVFTLMGDMANEANVEMQQADARGAGAGARLRIAEKMARALNDPAAQLEQLAADYVDQLARIEPGISYLVDCIVENPSLLGEEDVREFVRGIRTLAQEAEPALGQVSMLAEAAEETGKATNRLRPVTRRISTATRRISRSLHTMQEWRRRLDEFDEAA